MKRLIDHVYIFTLVTFIKSQEDKSGCPIPQTPYNGNYEVSGCSGILADPFDSPCWKDPNKNYPVGRVVSYFCHTGYVLSGPKSITCLANGKWNAAFPRCCIKSKKRKVDKYAGVEGSTLNIFEKAEERRETKAEDSEEDNGSCPLLERTKSIEFECRLPTTAEVNNCDKPPLPPYTVAHIKCAKYFRSTNDLAYRYRKCKPDLTWSTEGSITCINDCGKSDSSRKPLITNGETSSKGQWPWHASIYITDDKHVKEYICGGTLISSYAILTAAHCVTIPGSSTIRPKSSLTIGLGKHMRNMNAAELTPIQIRAPKLIFIPDSYNHFNFDSDIAIIVLSSPISFDFYVRPACIPENFNSLIEEYQLQEGNLGTVVGFGLTESGKLSNELRMAQLPVVSSRVCIDSFKAFFQQNRRYTNFCAGFKNGTGVCNGDSGGGMVFPSGQGNEMRWYLQGIVSVGVPDPDNANKCDPNQYSLFTRVGRFADWIVRTLTPDGYL